MTENIKELQEKIKSLYEENAFLRSLLTKIAKTASIIDELE